MPKIRKKPSGLCQWGCRRKASNPSRICDICWANRAELAALRHLDDALKPKKVLSEAAKEKLKAGRKAVSDAKMAIQATLGEKA